MVWCKLRLRGVGLRWCSIVDLKQEWCLYNIVIKWAVFTPHERVELFIMAMQSMEYRIKQINKPKQNK